MFDSDSLSYLSRLGLLCCLPTSLSFWQLILKVVYLEIFKSKLFFLLYGSWSRTLLLTLRLTEFAFTCYIKLWLLLQEKNSIWWLTFDYWYYLHSYCWYNLPLQISHTYLFNYGDLRDLLPTQCLSCSFPGDIEGFVWRYGCDLLED